MTIHMDKSLRSGGVQVSCSRAKTKTPIIYEQTTVILALLKRDGTNLFIKKLSHCEKQTQGKENCSRKILAASPIRKNSKDLPMVNSQNMQ